MGAQVGTLMNTTQGIIASRFTLPLPLMAEEELQLTPLARNVIAHRCAHCRCPDVDPGSSSEGSVGAASPEHSGSGLRHRGGTGNGSANGHVVQVRDSDQEDDDDDVLCVADLIATNLEELNSGRHVKLKLAYDDWEKTLDTLQKRREYKEAQRDAIRNEIYQVIGFYIVFQGVLVTAVAQASVLRCTNWWTTFILSLLTSLVTIGAVLQKLSEFWALETTIGSEKSTAKVPESPTHYISPGSKLCVPLQMASNPGYQNWGANWV